MALFVDWAIIRKSAQDLDNETNGSLTAVEFD
jgi:hypothetical protein